MKNFDIERRARICGCAYFNIKPHTDMIYIIKFDAALRFIGDHQYAQAFRIKRIII